MALDTDVKRMSTLRRIEDAPGRLVGYFISKAPLILEHGGAGVLATLNNWYGFAPFNGETNAAIIVGGTASVAAIARSFEDHDNYNMTSREGAIEDYNNVIARGVFRTGIYTGLVNTATAVITHMLIRHLTR